MKLIQSIAAVGLLLALAKPASAQESASSLARRAEDMLLRSAGVSMTFRLPEQGAISVKVDFRGKRIRIESQSTLVISDGSTLWNVNKSSGHVTIDNVAKTGSPFADPKSLFQFSGHYTASTKSHSGNSYSLDLTPDSKLAGLLKAAGGAQKLELDVTLKGKTLKIVKAQVIGASGAQQTSALRIVPMKNIRDEDFKLAITAKMKVLDLRE